MFSVQFLVIEIKTSLNRKISWKEESFMKQLDLKRNGRGMQKVLGQELIKVLMSLRGSGQ